MRQLTTVSVRLKDAPGLLHVDCAEVSLVGGALTLLDAGGDFIITFAPGTWLDVAYIYSPVGTNPTGGKET